MGNLLADLRYGLRLLLRSPGFTLVAILTLALGIGANTAIFSVVDAVLIRPLPYSDADRLVMVWEDASFVSFPRNTPAPANYVDWKNRNRSFSDMAAMRFRQATLTDESSPELAVGSGVTWSFFSLLGVQPQMGRAFTADEDKPDTRVVILSHGLWQRRYGGDPKLVGRAIRMNGEETTVIGVMPSYFRFPDKTTEYWVPAGFSPAEWANRGSHYLRVIARLKPGVTPEQAQSEMTGIALQLQKEHPLENRQIGAVVVPLREQVVGDTRVALIVLLAAAAAVLLIGCANLANLLLAKSSARTREIAVRTALGAGQGRLITQLLTESLLLSLLGGALGLAISRVSLNLLALFIPSQMTTHIQLTLNPRLLLFTVLISVLTGVVFGIAPAWRTAKLSLSEALKAGSKGDLGAQGQGFRNMLVTSEVALAVVLVVGAGLLIETLAHLRSIDTGFNSDRLLTMRLGFGGPKYREAKDRTAFQEATLEKVKALPGVELAAYCSNPPFTSIGNTNGFEIEGRPNFVDSDAHYRAGTADYLQSIGARLKEGRLLDRRDTQTSTPVVVINETLARRYFANESPVGKRMRYGSRGAWMTVVGVVEDVRERGLELAIKPATYVPASQQGGGAQYLLVRTKNDPLSIVSAVRDVIWSVDREQPITGVRTMEQMINLQLEGRQNQTTLLMIFAGLALSLAAIGIYGVLAYAVSQRTREIGLRMALGASHGDVVSMVLRKGLATSLAGVAIGVVASLALSRAMKAMLFGVSETDWRAYAAASVVLAVVTLAACYIPARRASLVDPMVALRDE